MGWHRFAPLGRVKGMVPGFDRARGDDHLSASILWRGQAQWRIRQTVPSKEPSSIFPRPGQHAHLGFQGNAKLLGHYFLHVFHQFENVGGGGRAGVFDPVGVFG